ncbi:MAG TPA: MBL fold metallo-hydrolase [Egibacteraceae bacterium]|nr:MBL fold metallo-hydrolase [Egibacteraceae bacterium]
MLGKESRYVEGFALGMWQANCYIVGDVELGRAVVVDPGQGGEPQVRERLEARGVRCEAILLTHGHLDHLWSAPELAEQLDVPVLLHPDDRWLWDDPAAGFGNLPPGALRDQFGLDWRPPRDRLESLRDGQTLSCAGVRTRVRHTPGHTPGSCVFLLEPDGVSADAVMLSGDLVFAGSVGRTDFPRGSWDQLLESIRRVVLPLPDPTAVLSGHGPQTTVGRERADNPFLRDIA